MWIRHAMIVIATVMRAATDQVFIELSIDWDN